MPTPSATGQSGGGSAYILSTGGATNEAARLLARKENLADVMGGWANDDTIDESDIITLDMVMTNTVNRSRELAQLSLRNISDINYLKFTQVQGAPFRVLKMPRSPRCSSRRPTSRTRRRRSCSGRRPSRTKWRGPSQRPS